MGDPGNVGRMRTGSIRIVAGFWGIVGLLMVPSGLAAGSWWILVAALLIAGGSAMLWWAGGRRVLPEGRASGDATFLRASRLRLVAVSVLVAGIVVTVVGFRTGSGS